MEDEDLIQREDMVVTVTHGGYIKRVPLSTYRAQRRGGKGRAGMATREEDFVTRLFVASTHTPVLFFSSRGMVYKEKVWRLPVGDPQARGKALINLLPLDAGRAHHHDHAAARGREHLGQARRDVRHHQRHVRRNKLSDFVEVQPQRQDRDEARRGRRESSTCRSAPRGRRAADHAHGQCIRFPVADVRVFAGRTSIGVRGIALAEGDRVISMSILRHVDATPPSARPI